jgi:tetratricopeptide (TPR) repeat protein
MSTKEKLRWHHGKLVAEYRGYKNMSQEALADAMKVSLRTVQRWEKEAVIKDRGRRQFLVALLGIPTAYMGLDDEDEQREKAVEEIATPLLFNDNPMSFIEDMVAHRWRTHLMGGPLSTFSGLERMVLEVRRFAEDVREKEWHQRAQTQLCMAYQLQGSVASDMMRYTIAQNMYREAFKVAEELKDVELMAAVRVREGIVLMRQDDPLQAITHFNHALNLSNGKGLPALRGNTFAVLSEAHAKAQQSQECWRAIGNASTILSQDSRGRERHYRDFSPARVAGHRGIDALLLGEYDRAIKLIDKSLQTYNPTQTPGRARLLARKAEALYGKKSITECTSVAIESLLLAHAVGANNTITRIRALCVSLEQSKWKGDAGVIHLRLALNDPHSA